MHSFTSLLADLATVGANQIQPADNMPAFTIITSPTPLHAGPSNSSMSPTAWATCSQYATPPRTRNPCSTPQPVTQPGGTSV